jgi:hypothetical protein
MWTETAMQWKWIQQKRKMIMIRNALGVDRLDTLFKIARRKLRTEKSMGRIFRKEDYNGW